LNEPLLSVVVLVTVPDGTWVTTTSAFGTGWPFATTWPLIVPVVSCAMAGVAMIAPAATGTKKAAQVRSKNALFTEITPPQTSRMLVIPRPAISGLRR
jgi:hypothetical protein